MTVTKMKVLLKDIKESDVFQFSPKDHGEFANWTRENLFIAIKEDGKLWLRDTYWGLGGNDNKKYSYSEANKLGKLSYYCNLKEIKSINEYDLDYYDDKDTFVLHDQHSCVPSCRYYFVKKDAKRSKVKMLEVLNEKLEEAKRNVERETRQVEEYATKKQQVENGKLDIYI